MDIIIFIIIISVVSNIIRGVARTRNAPPEDAPSPEPTPKHKAQKAKIEKYPPRSDHHVEIPRTEIIPIPKIQIELDSPTKTWEEIEPRRIRKPLKSAARPIKTSQEDKGEFRLKGFTRHRLMEGIILSEILGPPRSKRRI